MKVLSDVQSALGEQRVFLHNIRWSTYEQLLVDLANKRSPRLTYSKGTLELMTALPQHDRLTSLLESMISIFAAETSTVIYCLRSATFKHAQFESGFQPDSCFYIQTGVFMKDKEVIDLSVDSPPHLVVEVDMTSGSLRKLEVFSRLKVPEVWRHNGRNLVFYKLSGDTYLQSKNSIAFPAIESEAASEFIQANKNLTSTAFIKAFQEWATTLLGTSLRERPASY